VGAGRCVCAPGGGRGGGCGDPEKLGAGNGIKADRRETLPPFVDEEEDAAAVRRWRGRRGRR
ncbi:hypothetical protein BHM03_00051056, partial [Ensete ventricosum]